MRMKLAAKLVGVGALTVLLSGCSFLDSINPFSGDDKPKLQGQRQSIIRFNDKLVADPLLKGKPVVLPAMVTNATWSMTGGVAGHAPGNLALSSQLREVWRVKGGAGASSSLRYAGQPLVAGGRVYLLDAEGELAAFDADNGKQVWRVRVAAKTGASQTLSGGLAF